MKKFISLAVIAIMALSASAALAGQTPMIDEWNQPVMVQGAKGAPVQAYQDAPYTGECHQLSVGGNPWAVFNAVTEWTPIPDYKDVPMMTGSDYINQN